jgi:hypothetical protein
LSSTYCVLDYARREVRERKRKGIEMWKKRRGEEERGEEGRGGEERKCGNCS